MKKQKSIPEFLDFALNTKKASSSSEPEEDAFTQSVLSYINQTSKTYLSEISLNSTYAQRTVYNPA